jgi:hypothetical protein
MQPSKDIDAGGPPSPKGKAPAWLLWLVGAGLVLAGAGVALAIALPLTLRKTAPSSSADGMPFSLGSSDGTTRSYFLAAEPVAWDYAPSGRNLCKGQPFTKEQAVHITDGIGRVYTKAVFRQYADGSFKVMRGAAWHLAATAAVAVWSGRCTTKCVCCLQQIQGVLVLLSQSSSSHTPRAGCTHWPPCSSRPGDQPSAPDSNPSRRPSWETCSCLR